jgi:hypothetical protein
VGDLRVQTSAVLLTRHTHCNAENRGARALNLKVLDHDIAHAERMLPEAHFQKLDLPYTSI